MLNRKCSVILPLLANHKIFLACEIMTDELPIYHQVLYDQQAMQKCAHAFLNGEGSNPSGRICLLMSPIVQVVLRQTITKLTDPESQNEQEMKMIVLLKHLLQLLNLAQCNIWDMCVFLQPNEIVLDLSSILIHRKVFTTSC